MNYRIKHIDGIRGFAVLFVTFCHFTSLFLPEIKQASNSLGAVFNNTPLTFVIYGNASVQCFFILSGFLISSNIYGKTEVLYSPLRTYRKLFRIVMPAIVLTFILMKVGFIYHTKAADVYPELSYAYWYNTFTPTIRNMLKDLFYSTFFKYGSMYVPPFWTMSYEFVGTIMITALSYFVGHNKKNVFIFYGVICVIIIFMFPDDYAAFILGAMLFHVQEFFGKETGSPDSDSIIRKIIISNPFLIILLLIGVFLAGASGNSGIYKVLEYLPFIHKHMSVVRAFGAAICIFVILNSSLLKKILSFSVLSFIGKYSGQIYAFHWLTIISVGSGIYILLVPLIPRWLLLCLIFMVVMIIPIGLGYACKLLFKIVDMVEDAIAYKIKLWRG